MKTLVRFFLVCLALFVSVVALAQKVTSVNGTKMQQPELPFESLQIPLQPSTCLGTDALGNVGGPAGASCPGLASSYDAVNTFGDSLCQGTGASQFMTPGPSGTGYCQTLVALWGAGTNFGKGGDAVLDLGQKVLADLNPQPDHNPAVTFEIGTNDLNWYGTDTNKAASFVAGLEAAIAWAALPVQAKIFVTAAGGCTFTGTWFAAGGQQATQVANSSVSCPLTTYGPELYFVHWVADAYQGTGWTLTVDGKSLTGCASGLNSGRGGAAITTPNGQTGGFLLERCAVAPGLHTVVMTGTGANLQAGQNQAFEPVWLGSSGYYPGVKQPPIVFVSDQMPTRGTQTAAGTALYSSSIKTAVSTLQSDGINVRFVPHTFLNTTVDWDGGTLPNGQSCPNSPLPPYHPNDCGHRDIVRDFLAVMGFPHGARQALHTVTYPGPTPITFDKSSTTQTISISTERQATDSSFAISFVNGSTAVAANSTILNAHFSQPFAVMQNGADANLTPNCQFTPGSAATAALFPLWQLPGTGSGYIGIQAGAAGIPANAQLLIDVSCQQ